MSIEAHTVTPDFVVCLKQPKERKQEKKTKKKIHKQTKPAKPRNLYEVNRQKKCFMKKCSYLKALFGKYQMKLVT